MHPNAALIQSFYEAFSRRDGEAMAACYHPEATFSDPVFPALTGGDPGRMWRMLCAQGKDLTLRFDGVEADDQRGRAHWVATYTFSSTGRRVVNDIHAEFELRDGKIVRHVDTFDFWRWSRQALGLAGWLLGWTPWLRGKVRAQAQKALSRFTG